MSPPPSSGTCGRLGWWRSGVIYEIYVRSFQDSDGDGVGDLGGVRAGLPYLRSLGVDAIWLTPFYASPHHDHGYDVSDHLSVHPDYGDLAGFDRVVTDAHRLGIKVIVEVVPNHASTEHPWFTAALAAGPGSDERRRFHFADGTGPYGELPPNNWRSIFGGPAWRRISEPDHTPGQWYLHSFAPEQADFNWGHPAVAEHFEEVLRFWLDRGVDGFRIEVAHGLHKRPGLPDHPFAIDDELTGDPHNPYAWNQPDVHGVWRRWRSVVDEYTRRTGRERVLIGEVGVPDSAELAAYQAPGELHQCFYFDFLRAPWDAGSFAAVIERGLDTMTAIGSPVAWVLNNHDAPRAVTRYAGGAPGVGAGAVHLGITRARAAALLMLALPGSAFLYQGEELGLPEVTDLPEQVLTDPVFRWTSGSRRGRDGCRVPLPWIADDSSFGFSPAGSREPPWLPQPTWFVNHSVERQLECGESVLHLYRDALGLRHRLPALASTELHWLATDPGVLAFSRGDGFACLVNFAPQPVSPPAGARLLLGSDAEVSEKLPPDTAGWFLLDDVT